MKELKPLGLGVIMKSIHSCKSLRGVKNNGHMITSEMRGVFLKTTQNKHPKEEFMNLIGGEYNKTI